MRVWMDGFQVRCSFMIAVEAAAGAVFLPIIKPKPWVRRDGLSLDFLRRWGFPVDVAALGKCRKRSKG